MPSGVSFTMVDEHPTMALVLWDGRHSDFLLYYYDEKIDAIAFQSFGKS